MVFSILRAILCCCQSSDKDDDHQTYDERMHLIIPETIETAPGFTEEARSNQRRLRERLTEIVRSKEGRMVNVASQIPFNLHNRVIAKAHSPSSSSSTLGSANPHPFYSDLYSNRDIARLRKERSKYYHGLGRLRSTSRSSHCSDVVGPSFRTRSPSPSAEQQQPSAARLLNIRLVGFNTDHRTRGRARERTRQPTGLPGGGNSQSPITVDVVSDRPGSASAESSPTSARHPANFGLDFPDVNAMILTWD